MTMVGILNISKFEVILTVNYINDSGPSNFHPKTWTEDSHKELISGHRRGESVR